MKQTHTAKKSRHLRCNKQLHIVQCTKQPGLMPFQWPGASVVVVYIRCTGLWLAALVTLFTESCNFHCRYFSSIAGVSNSQQYVFFCSAQFHFSINLQVSWLRYSEFLVEPLFHFHHSLILNFVVCFGRRSCRAFTLLICSSLPKCCIFNFVTHD